MPFTHNILGEPVYRGIETVLWNESNTQKCFWETLKPDFKQKKNLVFIVAGGKGSGKTFTMQGLKDDPGLIPNFTSQIDYT